jgi:hypothetical protein
MLYCFSFAEKPVPTIRNLPTLLASGQVGDYSRIMDTASLTAPHAIRSTPWRRVISILLAVAVLLSSLHHLICVTDDEAPVPASAVAFSSTDQSLPPVNTDRCLPMHCHCACHGTAQTWTEVVSGPVEFGDATFGLREHHLPRMLAALPPFKPPRA